MFLCKSDKTFFRPDVPLAEDFPGIAEPPVTDPYWMPVPGRRPQPDILPPGVIPEPDQPLAPPVLDPPPEHIPPDIEDF